MQELRLDYYPKILIFGQPFNKYSGGGITLSNLFKGWPKDRIAVASTGHVLYKVSNEICDKYYRLGKGEQRWIFPFNLVQRPFPSGPLTFSSKNDTDKKPYKLNLRRLLVDRVFYPFLHWIGLYHTLSKISLSSDFRQWLADYNPEILYIQVTSREDVLFSIELCDYLQIPSVIHNMDDWPSTISKNGLFREYWRKKIDREFRLLLDRVDLFLSISDAMTEEYLRRYNKIFRAFHNPIDISKYSQLPKKSPEPEKTFRILYMGRIGLANRHSIFQFANAISQCKINGLRIEMDIFTYNTETRDAKRIRKLNNVKISPSVKHDLIPSLLTKYDLLLLPLDFTKAGFKYSKYSLPTKASEYMISGTPVLVFAPEETAISKFCAEKECGYCLTEQSDEKIVEALDFLISNEDYRKKLSSNAVRLATRLFDAEKVRTEFQQLLIDMSKRKSYV
jgi:glycosyltransferase involved in cell wall biosynthesis